MEMARYFNGTHIGLDRLPEIMEFADIVLTSTGAPHYIIEKNDMEQVMKKRRNRAIFLIDIAAPRDINPEVAKYENVFLYSIDNLAVVVKNNTSLREAEVEKVRNMLAEEWQNYFIWYESLKVLPTLISLRKKFEVLCSEELKRYSNEISKVPEPSRKLINRFASSLTKKYLRIPSRVLKEMTVDIDPIILAESVTQLFELNEETNNKQR
jgi:glutamyl-tRNA reductase